LQPWAWGPDSLELLDPLFQSGEDQPAERRRHFNERIAQLYSKAWSAGFLRTILEHCREWDETSSNENWLCSDSQAGVAVNSLEEALGAVAAIRGRGHHRVVVKAAHGLAGHNAIRLWEQAILPNQQQWLVRSLDQGRQLVVEPWLEREMDFSIHLEMEPDNLRLLGYTGLVSDLKGQYVGNWAEPGFTKRLPGKAAACFPALPGIAERIEQLYSVTASLLQGHLKEAGFTGPISIDAFIYRTARGDFRLKPIVEINPRYTMGRLTLELMEHVCAQREGVFRLFNKAQVTAAGFADFESYARAQAESFPLQMDQDHLRISQGAICLNDPNQAQACLAIFETRRHSGE
jgi:hypothetical protein